MTALRVALYARVSGEGQVDEGTIESQLDDLHRRIAADGLSVAPPMEFIEEGYSAELIVRPALERLRDLIASGGVDRLYLWHPDRLMRGYAYQVVLVEEFERAGVEVVFIKGSLGKTPEEKLLRQLQGMIAEYERTQILERSRRGRRYAARQGRVSVLGRAPYGYRYVAKAAGGGVARYEVVWEEAHVVRQIFRWVGGERVTLSEVARRLTAQGILPRGGGRWNRTTIWGMLTNPAYCGRAAYGKSCCGPRRPGVRPRRGAPEYPRRATSRYRVAEAEWIRIGVPALVEEALFNTVQGQLEENRRRARQRRASPVRHLLQGLLVCGRCGYGYYGVQSSQMTTSGERKRWRSYRCGEAVRARREGRPACPNRPLRAEGVEAAVWGAVRQLLEDPQRLEAEYRQRLAGEGAEGVSTELTRLTIQHRKLAQGIERLIDSYAEGLLQKEEFEPRLRQMRQRLAEVDNERRHCQDVRARQQELHLILGRFEDFAALLKSRVQEADETTRREVMRLLVKRIEVHEPQIRVIFRVGALPGGVGSQREGGPGRGDSPSADAGACEASAVPGEGGASEALPVSGGTLQHCLGLER